MAERKQTSALAKTRLAKLRLEHKVSQAALAEATGLSVRTIQELERNTHPNPRIGYLQNIATALEADLLDVCEPEWLAPLKFGGRTQDRRTTKPVEKAKHDLEHGQT